MAFEKGDIVRIDYNAYIADIDRLYDTTSESAAKDAGLYNEKYTYAPMAYVVGSKKLFKALDDAIANAEIGKEETVEIESSEAAGPRDPKLVEVYPIREFYKQEINPIPGLEVRLGNKTGIVMSAGAGRVKVDFNNPLAGKDLRYTFTVTEVVKDAEAKAKAIVEMNFGTSDGFNFKIDSEKVSVYLPDIVKFSQEWPMLRFRIVDDLRNAFGVDTVELVEVWSKAPAADVSKKEVEKEE
ncbi:MAG: FKBP-type peptidyl-prolyl cis-trans isomerase [Candidatus Methanomethylophilaceae archaeon]|nr:FKBP-type peptidyl-prolyl cis-trans isomerase [Candidatus Methanomethylophilaceae archaeon]